MSRIFSTLALFAVLCVLGTLLLGLGLRRGDIRDPQDLDAKHWATVHRLSGIATGLSVLLVNSIVVTYFIGTSRWCKEVVETYSLDASLVQRTTRLKRRTFPIAVLSMLMAVGIVALGGAADPAASLQLEPPGDLTWANLHFMAAALGLCLIGCGFVRQYSYIRANHRVISDVMAEVKRIRAERGLQ